MRQRFVKLQIVLQFGQAEKHDVEQFLAGQLQVEKSAKLLHEFPRLQHLGLVDQDDGPAPLLVDLNQAFVKLLEKVELVGGGLIHAQLHGDAGENPFGRDAGVNHDQERRLVLAFRQVIQHAASQGRLAGPDAADEHGQPLVGIDCVHEADQGLTMLLAVVVESRIGGIGEGLAVKTVMLDIAHAVSVTELTLLARRTISGLYRRSCFPGRYFHRCHLRPVRLFYRGHRESPTEPPAPV